MAATVFKIPRPNRSLWVRSYVPEAIRGLSITSRQFFVNLFTKKEVVTIAYPEVKRDYPERYRGLHRLMYREDDQVRCVACMLCSTACPANCIHIVAGEHEDPTIEKYPVSFVIDELRCIVCGPFVEACPSDPIPMDSGTHMHALYERDQTGMDNALLPELGCPCPAG